MLEQGRKQAGREGSKVEKERERERETLRKRETLHFQIAEARP